MRGMGQASELQNDPCSSWSSKNVSTPSNVVSEGGATPQMWMDADSLCASLLSSQMNLNAASQNQANSFINSYLQGKSFSGRRIMVEKCLINTVDFGSIS